jgi:hypothetical protein
MSSGRRVFLCLLAGGVCAGFFFLLGLIFVPLLVPLSLAEPDPGPDRAIVAMLLVTLLIGIGGFLLAWKISARYDKPPF